MHNIIQMETSAKLYSLPFGNVKTYLFALLFVAGNIALPHSAIWSQQAVRRCFPSISLH